MVVQVYKDIITDVPHNCNFRNMLENNEVSAVG